jgi:penicillin-binding protein 2
VRPTRFKNPQAEDGQFQLRLIVAYVFMLLMFCMLIARFVWLQVYQYEHFSTLAQNNRISLLPILPNRGLIMDRNGVILAQNYSAYTLELVPSKMPDMNATIAELKKLVNITPRDEKLFKKLLGESKDFESIPLKVKLSEEEAARVAANAWRFPGVQVKARCSATTLQGTHQPCAGLYRPHQPERPGAAGRRRQDHQLQGHQLHRQDRPGSGVRG